MLDLSIVVPVYNEEENLDELCAQLNEVLSSMDRSYEVLLVDDGSSDGSWEKMTDLARRYPNLCQIRLRRNFGQTAAMSAGFHQSLGQIVITLDADMQNDPRDIPLLLEHMGDGADVVSGWRKDRKDKFWSRRLPSIIANSLISKITGVHLHDYGCTLKAYDRDVIKNIQLYGEMHRFIPALASWVGEKIDEVPVRHHPRKRGASKYGISRTFRVVLDLITVKFLLRYSMGPMQMFGKAGAVFMVPGLLILAFVILAHLSFLVFGTEFAAGYVKRPFWTITPALLIFLGMQFFSIGLLAEVQTRTYHESQNKKTYVISRILRDGREVEGE